MNILTGHERQVKSKFHSQKPQEWIISKWRKKSHKVVTKCGHSLKNIAFNFVLKWLQKNLVQLKTQSYAVYE